MWGECGCVLVSVPTVSDLFSPETLVCNVVCSGPDCEFVEP